MLTTVLSFSICYSNANVENGEIILKSWKGSILSAIPSSTVNRPVTTPMGQELW